MKTPTCKECKGTGSVCIEGEWVSRPMTITCWVCSGTAFKGMNRDQIAWYLMQFKTFDKLKAKSLKAGEVSDPLAYQTFKLNINKACVRLGIALVTVARTKSTQFGVSDTALFLRAELNEYERRLSAIPVAASKKGAIAA